MKKHSFIIAKRNPSLFLFNASSDLVGILDVKKASSPRVPLLSFNVKLLKKPFLSTHFTQSRYLSFSRLVFEVFNSGRRRVMCFYLILIVPLLRLFNQLGSLFAVRKSGILPMPHQPQMVALPSLVSLIQLASIIWKFLSRTSSTKHQFESVYQSKVG